MAKFIECRSCDSPYCDGCNIYSLATMLNRGKFNCLKDNNNSVNCSADVVEVVRCKNCKYFDIEEDDALGTCMGKFICVSSGGEIYPEPNHCCSYGERRSDE